MQHRRSYTYAHTTVDAPLIRRPSLYSYILHAHAVYVCSVRVQCTCAVYVCSVRVQCTYTVYVYIPRLTVGSREKKRRDKNLA